MCMQSHTGARSGGRGADTTGSRVFVRVPSVRAPAVLRARVVRARARITVQRGRVVRACEAQDST